MTKIAINEQGDEVEVSDSTPVKTVDGVHYLLTESDQDEISQKENEYTQKKASLLNSYKNVYRKLREDEGVSHEGNIYDSDIGAQIKLTPVYIKASSNPSFSKSWKTQDGSFVTLDQAGFIAMAEAIFSHVDKCFQALEAIQGTAYNSKAEIETAFDNAYNS